MIPAAAVASKERQKLAPSRAGSEKRKIPCRFLCGTQISCSVYPSGKVDENGLQTHEKICTKNPDRVVFSVKGLTVGDSPLFGLPGSDAEFKAPAHVLAMKQGCEKPMDGVIHTFPDGSFHAMVGKKTNEPIIPYHFFARNVSCCWPEDGSMMLFKKRPELFPKLFDDERFLVAELNTTQIPGLPAPWTQSELRRVAIKAGIYKDATCSVCHRSIQMIIYSCGQGAGPCKFCNGCNLGEQLPYERSFHKYLVDKNLPWITVPDARTIYMQQSTPVQMTCTLCETTWYDRRPSNQVNQNLGCPGCSENYRAEKFAYDLYAFVLQDADLFRRGHAILTGVHANPYDIASRTHKVVVEVMSFKWHVEDGKLPIDIDKMLAVLRKGYVYIMAHCEDFGKNPRRELAWKRCLAYALRQAGENPTPRVIHVRRDVAWTAYDSMRDAAMAAEIGYQDVFCGDVNAHATERLPDETHAQTTLPWGAAAGASAN